MTEGFPAKGGPATSPLEKRDVSLACGGSMARQAGRRATTRATFRAWR